MKRLFAVVVASSLALTFAACGDDDDDSGGSSAAPATTEQTDAARQSAAEAKGAPPVVEMKDIKFIPHDVKVDLGGIVQWQNNDSVPHTVTWKSGPGTKFDSGNIPPGGTFEVRLDKPGTVDYVCTIHPGQDGTITAK